jgi:hypothetical protein
VKDALRDLLVDTAEDRICALEDITTSETKKTGGKKSKNTVFKNCRHGSKHL